MSEAPKQHITIDFRQATDLLAMFAGDPGEITLMLGDETSHSGPGLYACITDYPEEGSLFLGKSDGTAEATESEPNTVAVCFVSDRFVYRPKGPWGPNVIDRNTGRWMGLDLAREYAAVVNAIPHKD